MAEETLAKQMEDRLARIGGTPVGGAIDASFQIRTAQEQMQKAQAPKDAGNAAFWANQSVQQASNPAPAVTGPGIPDFPDLNDLSTRVELLHSQSRQQWLDLTSALKATEQTLADLTELHKLLEADPRLARVLSITKRLGL